MDHHLASLIDTSSPQTPKNNSIQSSFNAGVQSTPQLAFPIPRPTSNNIESRTKQLLLKHPLRQTLTMVLSRHAFCVLSLGKEFAVVHVCIGEAYAAQGGDFGRIVEIVFVP
jgi:hypothetical protein